MITTYFLIASCLLLASIVASKLSTELGVPALLLFLLVGMLAGSDGPGGIYFDDAALAKSVGVIALVFILYSGGLSTNLRSLRPLFWPIFSLATVAVIISTVVVGLFLASCFNFGLQSSFLLGALISSTDAAAVFSLVRKRNLYVNERLKLIAEGEAGCNDPTAVFLTSILLVPLVAGEMRSVAYDALAMFVSQMVLGAAIGFSGGEFLRISVNRIRLEFQGLYPVLSMATVLGIYALTELSGGNGFLGVYVAGLAMSRRDFIHRQALIRFHDGLAWLVQVTMFLILGLLVFPSKLPPLIFEGVILALFLVFVARPLSVLVSLSFTSFSWREKIALSIVGLRGAVPIILGTFPMVAGIPDSELIFHLVFFVVFLSALLQGGAASLSLRLLGCADAVVAEPFRAAELELAPGISREIFEFVIPPNNHTAGRQLLDLNLPAGILVLLVHRNGESFVPNGSSILVSGDKLLCFGDRESIMRATRILNPAANGGLISEV